VAFRTHANAGLNALTLDLAGAYLHTVRANTAMPAFDTALAWTPEAIETANALNPLGLIGQPRDMVGVCLFLASDASRYVNGACILVDGGAFRTL
jgi:NAD(P)-dependent dehydrogenase (short-subunit alcohol dehydrogenase family)